MTVFILFISFCFSASMDSNQVSTIIEVEPSIENDTKVAKKSSKRGRPKNVEKSPTMVKSRRLQPKIKSKPRGRPKSKTTVHSWEKLGFIESLKEEKVINIACGENCSFSVTISGN